MVWGLMINYMKLPIEERLEALAKIPDQVRTYVRKSSLPEDVIRLYVRKSRESFRTRNVDAI